MSRLLAAALLAASFTAAPARAEEAAAAPAPAAAPVAAPAAPAPVPGAAQPAKAPVSSRDLAGHTFQPAVGVSSAFASTSFGTYLLAGYGSTTGTATLTLPDGTTQPITGAVDYGAIGGALHYSVRLMDNLSVRMELVEALFTGVTGAAAAVVGTNAHLGGGVGLTWSIPVADSLRLAALADVSYSPNMGLLLGPALQDAFDSCSTGLANCEVDTSKLFNQNNVFEFRPGAAVAWVPTRSLGVTANLAWVQLSQQRAGAETGTRSASGVDGALSLDFDLGALTSVPVGLQANVTTRVPVSGEGATRYTDVGGALLYTGRKELAVGLHVVTRRFKVVPEVEVSWATILVTTGLTYYW